jgi:beta-glucosidase
MTEIPSDWMQLSLKEQIGQMIVVRASGYLFDQQIRYPTWEPPNTKLLDWVQRLNVGGIILLGGSAAELALRSRQLQTWATIPLFIAADVEEGVGQRFDGATEFPPPMALGAIARQNLDLAKNYALQMGAITAKESLAIGINWILAPIVDVNNNPNNPVINIRAFGDTPGIVSQLATSFILGAKAYPVLTTAKHFPGHGDTAMDSHLNLPRLTHSETRLEEIELPPFEAAIASGVDSVMTAHLLINAWDSQRPATLSPAILTGQLRKQLGFEGLIVTDALIMGGMTQYASENQLSLEELSILALEAGADILLMPSDPEATINAIEQAVQSGRLTQSRIQASLARIWRAKRKVTQPPVANFLSHLAASSALETSEAILGESLQKGGNLPINPSKLEKLRALVVVDDYLKSDFLGHHTPAITIPKQLGYEIQVIESSLLSLLPLPEKPLFLQVFLRGNPFRGSAGLTESTKQAYQKLLQQNHLQGLIIYGSPYVLEWFLPQIPSELPWVFSYGQIPLAQAIACQSLFSLSKLDDVQGEAFL